MTSRTKRAFLHRLGALLVAGTAMFSSCETTVDVPGIALDNSDGISVGFPGGKVEVSERGVFVDAPFVSVELPAK